MCCRPFSLQKFKYMKNVVFGHYRADNGLFWPGQNRGVPKIFIFHVFRPHLIRFDHLNQGFQIFLRKLSFMDWCNCPMVMYFTLGFHETGNKLVFFQSGWSVCNAIFCKSISDFMLVDMVIMRVSHV